MTDDNTGGGPIAPLTEDDTPTRHAVYNDTLARFDGGPYATKTEAQDAAKELRAGKRKGHKLSVRAV